MEIAIIVAIIAAIAGVILFMTTDRVNAKKRKIMCITLGVIGVAIYILAFSVP